MPASQNNNLNLQNICIWFQCVECQRCFHALPLLQKHFLEQHKEKRFVLPTNLPPGAREGKLFTKNSSQEKHTEQQPQKYLASTAENVAADQPVNLSSSPLNVDLKCAICKTRFKTKSAFNFHFKKMHQLISAKDVSKKTEKKSTSDAELSIRQKENGNGAARKHRSVMTTKDKASVVTKAAIKATRKRRIEGFVNADYAISVKNGNKYICCRKCPFHTLSMVYFNAHLKLHQKSSTAVSCSLCGWFVPSRFLNAHWGKRHPRVNKKKLNTVDKL